MLLLRNILFSIIAISILLIGMEYSADVYLRNSPGYLQTYIILNAQPLLEYAPETKASPPYHFRRKANNAKKVAWHKDSNGVLQKLFFSEEEGMIRNTMGDHVLNKWGFRGPYFEKEPPFLIRSIFMHEAKLSVEMGEVEQAKNILKIIKTLKPNFKDNIDIFQKKLLKES